MTEAWLYRLMEPGEEAAVCDLVARVFDDFVAPDYAEDGIEAFRKYVQPDLLSQRSRTNHFVLLAINDGQIGGMIEVRDYHHICLFFVDGQFQGQGIGRELLCRSLTICRQSRPDLRAVSVNSAPHAVPTYERLDFRPATPEQSIEGIRFTPMVLDL